MNEANQQYASWLPDDLHEGGSGLWDNVMGRITAIQFSTNPPPNYKQGDQAGIYAYVTFLLDGDAPVEERTVTEIFSCGGIGAVYDIVNDGFSLKAKTEDARISKKCKFATFVASLLSEGVPANLIKTGDFRPIVGVHALWKRVVDKVVKEIREREGDTKTADGKKKFDPTLIVCGGKLTMPGEKGNSGSGQTAGAPATAASSEDFNLDAETSSRLIELLRSKGKPIQRTQLTVFMSTELTSNKAKDPVGYDNRTPIAKRAGNVEFLKGLAEMGLIVYDPSVKNEPVSLPAAA